MIILFVYYAAKGASIIQKNHNKCFSKYLELFNESK